MDAFFKPLPASLNLFYVRGELFVHRSIISSRKDLKPPDWLLGEEIMRTIIFNLICSRPGRRGPGLSALHTLEKEQLSARSPKAS